MEAYPLMMKGGNNGSGRHLQTPVPHAEDDFFQGERNLVAVFDFDYDAWLHLFYLAPGSEGFECSMTFRRSDTISSIIHCFEDRTAPFWQQLRMRLKNLRSR